MTEGTEGANPKDETARLCGKVRLDLLEPAADEQIATVLAHGAAKYGIRNFTAQPIGARTYAAAIRRHLAAWQRGEDVDPDSGVSHLAHIGANIHVVLAASEAGTLHDDRLDAEVIRPEIGPAKIEPSA